MLVGFNDSSVIDKKDFEFNETKNLKISCDLRCSFLGDATHPFAPPPPPPPPDIVLTTSIDLFTKVTKHLCIKYFEILSVVLVMLCE